MHTVWIERTRAPLANLELWRDALSLAALRDTTHVQSTHPLDEYSMYATHGHSFYMSDGRRPTGIFIVPGMGLDQRQESPVGTGCQRESGGTDSYLRVDRYSRA